MTNAAHITPDLSDATWCTSSYSGGHNECVQVATNLPDIAPVRDSKRPAGPTLTFPHPAWQSFVRQLA